MDKTLVVEVLGSFKPEINLDLTGKKLAYTIRALLEKDNNQYEGYLISIRQIFLSRAQVQSLRPTENKRIKGWCLENPEIGKFCYFVETISLRC